MLFFLFVAVVAVVVVVVIVKRRRPFSSSSNLFSPKLPPRPPLTVSAVFHVGPGGEALSAKSHDRARPLEDGTVAEDAHTVEYSRWRLVPSLGLRVPLALDMRWDLVTPFPYGRLRIKEIEGAAVAGVGSGGGGGGGNAVGSWGGSSGSGGSGFGGGGNSRSGGGSGSGSGSAVSSSVCLETFDFEATGWRK